MKSITLSVLFALSSTAALPALAQSSTGLTQTSASTQQYSDAQLDSVLAPIALYPDTLLTHILIAATYPLDVVAADRWRQSNKHLTPQQVDNVLANVSWDPSVKALASFTDLLNTMANDLQWLQQLGDNVLIDQSRVLDRVQVLRQHAHNTGNLVTNDYIEVETERRHTREVIYIEPRQREVVYVPYYDPHVVYGHWWHTTSPVRWRHQVSYHHHSNVFWSPSIHLSTAFFFGSVHWHNRHVVIHREPVRRYYRGSPRKRVVSKGYRRWEHNTVHRRARYSNPVVHSAPSRFEKAGVARAKHLSNKQGTINRKPSIEHALKRNQSHVRSEKPQRNNTLKQLRRDNAKSVAPVKAPKRFANRGDEIQRLPKRHVNRQHIERTRPQHRSIARESTKPKRIERTNNKPKRIERASNNRPVKREKSNRQVSRVERSVSRGNGDKH
ncbi:MAG: DUF3300 domain-containing protein [Gammaproteobacteria bacterium]|nr:DUF3300 domain-containing protein [Gammaproteobacteria bacterium]